MTYFIGIDVGTGSARAGIFDASGRLLAAESRPIAMQRPREDYAEQSSRDIWESVCHCVRAACRSAGIDGTQITGLGFDATCSLVVVDGEGEPVTVSPSGDDDWNIIVWMDHRAIEDAQTINAIGGEVLTYVGGVISPEMELPKLRWLKRNMPQSFERAAAFFDLPDWLVHRATGTQTRSLCSTVCKWTYLGQKGLSGEGWDSDFLARIGLESLSRSGFAAIGGTFAAPGARAGSLSPKAAEDLGLAEGIAVSASLIDAYAGALGTLGVEMAHGGLDTRLALIAGTSSCHITVSPTPPFVPGVWGPYFSVLLPEMWANEAGQSAAGALIDRIIEGHAAAAEAKALAASNGISLYELLAERLAVLATAEDGDTAGLTFDRHVQPDFHGNRSPLADPTRKGAIVGLSLDRGLDDLALDYLATLQALAYGTRQIIEEMRCKGVRVELLVVSGGLAQNALFLREHADATQCAIIVPEQREPVLVGSAMLGAVASGHFPDLPAAMQAMSGRGRVLAPRGGKVASFHDRKYRVFQRLQQDFAAYAALMAD